MTTNEKLVLVPKKLYTSLQQPKLSN